MTDDNELLDLCRRHLDPAARTHPDHTDNHPTVLRATTSLGDVIVKRHHQPPRHHNEVRAYRQWAPTMGDRAPTLLASVDDPPTIIVTAFAGKPLAHEQLSSDRERDTYRQAGELLARWHTAAPATGPVPITEWLAERGEVWLHTAASLLPATELRRVRTHLRRLAELGPLPTVPCHLDFTPANLLYHPTRPLHLIDFEHARFDLPARDLVRLADRRWPTRPDLKTAFQDGYGPLTDHDHAIIEHCTPLDRLTRTLRAAGITPPRTLSPAPGTPQ